MATQFEDDIMNKHFELAGIEPDEPKVEGETKEEGKTDADPKREEGKPDDGEPDLFAEPKAKEPADKGKEPTADSKDSKSSGADDKSQPGKEEKVEKPAGPGDLTLPDGQIVRAGKERRWFEERETARRENAATKQELNTWKQKYEAADVRLKAIDDAAKQVNGVAPEEIAKAVRLYKDLRTDPQATMKQLLVDMKELGYDFSSIGGVVDTQAIINAITNQSKTSVEQEQKQEVDPIKEEVDKFFGTFADAKLHEPLIAAVLEQNPNATLVEAYQAVKNAALENGFDWSKPLIPQIEAKQAAEAAQPPKKDDKPIINGRNIDQGNADIHSDKKAVTQGETWEDIIRGGMKDGGLNIQ